ncbi:MAG: UDP-N-acetylglucosamine 2-epimerase (non-hydrolyzing) [Alphaproteobacteria bacterium]|jgi:UDP-GlcNAc3NAcA epimerase|nr:UDP-N-acetylglucosamine 2-epimerase (non-hydrolyzing) [Alphaproteobacteria bacterium]MBP7729457.1 UDP-N-acetylglucosamine 2-epimerase (non-hydrolyzing) [Alphaproteobacteria bacterium]
MKIFTIIGTRPQFIKAAPVSKAFKSIGIKEFVLHTGQHYDPLMSNIFFEELKLEKPDLNLHINGGNHGQQTGRMLECIEEALIKEKPDRVLVYGDTNSTLAGALAATKLHIPLYHVEAGLRSFNKKMPEEVNRVLTDHLSTLLFTPTALATQNLKKEGFSEENIKEVGDVMYDAILHFNTLADNRKDSILGKLLLKEREYYLATIHRAENTDSPQNLERIFEAFENLSENTKIVLPVHPRIKEKINNIKFKRENIILTEPFGYLDMQVLTRYSSLVLTDSGGLQKEAYILGVPCITLRDQTEWMELVECGWNKLIPVNENLSRELKEWVQIMETRNLLEKKDFYGDGFASKKIAHFLANS